MYLLELYFEVSTTPWHGGGVQTSVEGGLHQGCMQTAMKACLDGVDLKERYMLAYFQRGLHNSPA